MRLFTAIFLGILFTVNAGAEECDDLSFDIIQSGLSTYNPADLQEGVISLSISPGDDFDDECLTATVTIETQSGSAYIFQNAGNQISGNFISSGLLISTGPQSSQLSTSALQQLIDGQTITVDFLSIPAGQFSIPGTYTLPMEVNTDEEEEEETFVLSLETVAGLRFEGEHSDGEGSISLGSLTADASGETTFLFNANTSLSVIAVSENQGSLVHEGGVSLGAIPYIAFLSGTPLSLDGTNPKIVNYNGGTVSAETVRVEVPFTENYYAGTYRDVITLTFTSF